MNVLVANLKWFHFIVYTKASSSGMWLQRGLGKFGKKQAKQAKKIIDYMHKFLIIFAAYYSKVHIDFLEGKKTTGITSRAVH